MTTRWHFSEDGGTTFDRLVTPYNNNGKAVKWARNLDKGHAFYRRVLSGPLRFRGDDYIFIRALDRTPSGRCKRVFLRYQVLHGQVWQELWRGQFAVNDGIFDYTLCEYEVSPATVDRYNCLLEREDVKENILTVLPVTARAAILPPNVEFAMCSESGSDCADVFRINHGWSVAHSWDISGTTYRLYWREKVIRPCVYDPALGYFLPSPPPGEDWQLIGNACNASGPDVNCLEQGSSLYVRQVDASYTFGTPVLGTGSAETGRIPPEGCYPAIYVGDTYDPPSPPAVSCSAYPNDYTPHGSYGNWFICLNEGTTQAYNRARTLTGVIGYLVNRTGCDIAGIRSNFFGINPTGTPDGTNYVTGLPSETEGVLLLQKTDAINPSASNPATVAEMSFVELMETMATAYRVLWDIDTDGFLRIEHRTYWTAQNAANGLNVRTWPEKKRVEPSKRLALSPEIPRIERPRWAEAQGVDFIGRDIIYTGTCAATTARGEVKTYNLGRFTTDLGFVQNDPDAIRNDGFVLLATRYNADEQVYDVITTQGALSHDVVVNAPLSWANLERDFWTWDRFLPTAEMNGAEVTFDGYLPNIEQKGIVLIGFCGEALRFDPRKPVTTELGEVHLGGITGQVESAELDVLGVLNLVLRYSR